MMRERALETPAFYLRWALGWATWTFSALSAVGILESTERQQSAKNGHSASLTRPGGFSHRYRGHNAPPVHPHS